MDDGGTLGKLASFDDVLAVDRVSGRRGNLRIFVWGLAVLALSPMALALNGESLCHSPLGRVEPRRGEGRAVTLLGYINR